MAFITEGEISILDENDTTTVGGFDFREFIDELFSEQKCPICLFAMRSPVQTVCGHRFCESCLIRTFSENSVPVCPQDRQPISQNGGWFYDKAWERSILSLRVRCKKSDRGCGWTGEIRDWQEHSKVCQYEDVTCEKCYQYVQRVSLDKHTTSECSSRIVICEYCKEEFEFWRKEGHENTHCTRFPLDCPQGCGVPGIPREELESHARDDCMMTMVFCPYEGAGCTYHGRRNNLKAHLEASMEEHLRKIWFKDLETTERLNKFENEMNSMKVQLNELEDTEEQMRELQLEMVSIKKNYNEEIDDLKFSRDNLEKENVELKEKVGKLNEQMEEIKRTTANKMQKLSGAVQMIWGKFQAIAVKQPLNPTSGLTRPMTPSGLHVAARPPNTTIQSTQPSISTSMFKGPLIPTSKITEAPILTSTITGTTIPTSKVSGTPILTRKITSPTILPIQMQVPRVFIPLQPGPRQSTSQFSTLKELQTTNLVKKRKINELECNNGQPKKTICRDRSQQSNRLPIETERRSVHNPQKGENSDEDEHLDVDENSEKDSRSPEASPGSAETDRSVHSPQESENSDEDDNSDKDSSSPESAETDRPVHSPQKSENSDEDDNSDKDSSSPESSD